MTDLNFKQRKAIAALLTENSIVSAAEKAGVNERTIRRWLGDDFFHDALMGAIAERTKETLARLKAGESEAVDTIYRGMTESEFSYGRVRSARLWLDYGGKFLETQLILDRLDEIERRLNA